MRARESHEVQDFLGRQILIENVSSYLQFEASTLREWEFVAGVAEESGCGILLDLNNIYVAAHNHSFDCLDLPARHPAARRTGIALGWSQPVNLDGTEVLIDTHGTPVCEAVWELYRAALERFGALPTLIEWDTDIPEFHRAAGRSRQSGRAAGEPTCSRCVSLQTDFMGALLGGGSRPRARCSRQAARRLRAACDLPEQCAG